LFERRWFGVHALSLRQQEMGQVAARAKSAGSQVCWIASLFHDKSTGITSLKPQAFCRIQREQAMTATIVPWIVQLAFGFGNLISAQWLEMRGLSGQATTEDIEMFARKGVFSSIGRAGAAATIVAVALTAFQPSTAFAGSAPANGATATTGTSTATDFSSRGRYYRGGGGGAAAAAAFAGIVGTGIAIAAAQNRRDYYDSYGYYGGGPAYYAAPPAYYGGGPVYYGGGGYYRNSGVPHYRGHPLASW
jgi:hypothetical protein